MHKKKLLEILDDHSTARRIAIKTHGCADDFNSRGRHYKENAIEDIEDVISALKEILIQQGVL